MVPTVRGGHAGPLRRAERLWLWGPLLAAGVVYAPFLNSPLIWDDRVYLVESPFTHDPRNAWKVFVPRAYYAAGHPAPPHVYRPFPWLTLVAESSIGGLTPWAHRVFNLACHLLCGWLLWTLGRAFGAEPAWLGPALLVFLLHPAHSELLYCSAFREALMATAGVLAAWLAWIHGRFVWGALAFASALLCKELALVAPALAWLTVPETRRPARWGPLLAVTVGYLWIRNRLLPVELDPNVLGSAAGMGGHLLRIVAAVPEIARLALWPSWLGLDYGLPAPSGVTDAPVLIGAGWLGLFLATLVVLARHDRPAAALLLAAGLAYPVSAPIVPLTGYGYAVMERALYLPLACVGLVMARALTRLASVRRPVARGLAAVLLAGGLAGGVRTALRGVEWRDEERLLRSQLARFPDSTGARGHLAHLYQREGRMAEAEVEFRRVLDLHPVPRVAAAALMGRGGALKGLGRYQEAQRSYRAALALAPRDARVLFNLGHLARVRGHRAEARRWYERAVAADPAFAPPLLMLGKLAYEAGRLAEAEAWFQRYEAVQRGR